METPAFDGDSLTTFIIMVYSQILEIKGPTVLSTEEYLVNLSRRWSVGISHTSLAVG